jgi:hypothetical protein
MSREITVGSNQPYLFPYIGYWQLMNLSDVYVISDSMQYIKKGYINRNTILVDGNRHMFTLEVMGVHGDSLINEVKVGNNRKKLVKSFFHSYKKAPFFEDVYPLVEEILLNREDNLARYIGNSMEKIAKYLNIETNFIYLSDLQGKTALKAQDRTIDICKRVNASRYINAIGGEKLYNKKDFKKENIELNFLKSGDIKYRQFNSNFISNLSIIDVMMFNSKDNIRDILEDYWLV